MIIDYFYYKLYVKVDIERNIMQITSMKSHRCGDLREKNVNEQVKLSGWVSTIRDLGGIIFVELRDR